MKKLRQEHISIIWKDSKGITLNDKKLYLRVKRVIKHTKAMVAFYQAELAFWKELE